MDVNRALEEAQLTWLPQMVARTVGRKPLDVDDIAQEAVRRFLPHATRIAVSDWPVFMQQIVRNLINETFRQRMTRRPLAGAGWHPDPFTDSRSRLDVASPRTTLPLRWFDGRHWTDRRKLGATGEEHRSTVPSGQQGKLRPRCASLSMDDMVEIGIEIVADGSFDPEAAVLRAELFAGLEHALGQRHWQVLFRHAVRRESLQSIADDLGVPAGTVRRWFSEARAVAADVIRVEAA